MTIREKTPEEREEIIVLALMSSCSMPRGRAEALLMEHDADVLTEVDKEISTLENPYRLNGSRLKWTEGVLAVQSRVFMKALRLRMRAVRKATEVITEEKRGKFAHG